MRKFVAIGAAAAALVAAAFLASVSQASGPAFSNTPLIATWSPPEGLTTQPNENSTGDSEPAIAFGNDGKMAVDGLAWLPFQVNLWTGKFGDMPPDYFGGMDTMVNVPGNGRLGLGSGDADVAITSNGTILLVDLDFIVNKQFNFTLGVSVTRCPSGATHPSGCTTTLLDQSGADRPWITVDGTSAWVAYHDSGNSSTIHVLRSTDDGVTWAKVGNPIVGQGRTTGNATFNNENGPIVADPHTGNLYDVYAAGEPSVQKGTSGDFNNIFVSRSTDGGRTWTAHLVHHEPLFTSLNNIFPSLAADPSDGTLYAVWSDQKAIWVSTSSDEGTTWSDPVQVSSSEATPTVVMPWVAALDGKVDVVYYGTSASSIDDENAVWNVYDAQSTGSGWTIKQVSNTPNRVGAVCLEGAGCSGDRQLLDLFEVAEDPVSGKAAVVYTDSTIDTYTLDGATHELPEIVLAYEQ